MQITRIYADEQGSSHFADDEVSFAEGSPLRWSANRPATGFEFLTAPAGFTSSFHTASRQYVLPLSGAITDEASDGETRTFIPGSVLLDDSSEQGHRTIVDVAEDLCVAIVLAPDAGS
jgi:hypothetical protein